MNKEKTKEISMPLIITEIGLRISIPLVLFVVLGIWLDRRFNTLPLFLSICIFISLFITTYGILTVIKKHFKDFK